MVLFKCESRRCCTKNIIISLASYKYNSSINMYNCTQLICSPEYLRFYIALNNNSCEPFTQDRQVSSLYEDEENIHI